MSRETGARLALGVRRGDTVLTLIGNRPEWVITMVACFRQGFVALPCTEQLRAGDLRLRLRVDLGEGDVGMPGGSGVEDRRERATGTAPRRPEVDEDDSVGRDRRVERLGGELRGAHTPNGFASTMVTDKDLPFGAS